MKIYIFDDFTGMIEERFHPNYKTIVAVIGKVREGTLSIGSQNFDVTEGEAIVPVSAFGEAKTLKISVTAKIDGKTRHCPCGEIMRDNTGAYKPESIDGRAALIEARRKIDELHRELHALERKFKAHSDKSKQKFMGGHDL